jgi:hypothetical protein
LIAMAGLGKGGSFLRHLSPPKLGWRIVAAMAFRRFGSIGDSSPLMANLPRLRNRLVAERERLALKRRA